MDYMTRLAIFDSAQQWEKIDGGYRSKEGHTLKKGKGKKWMLTHKSGKTIELATATFPGAEKALQELEK